jgi:hypothetical protein
MLTNMAAVRRLWSTDDGEGRDAVVTVHEMCRTGVGGERIQSAGGDADVAGSWCADGVLGGARCGQGTNASRLSQFLKVPHIAMGDLVRNETSSRRGAILERLMASGKLLPDEIIFELLAKRLESGESRGESGFVLDGFPGRLTRRGLWAKLPTSTWLSTCDCVRMWRWRNV